MPGVKILTLHQLRDIIDDIMISKRDFDQNHLQNSLPRETLEQYLYTYLTKKYGLKVILFHEEPGGGLGFHHYQHDRAALET